MKSFVLLHIIMVFGLLGCASTHTAQINGNITEKIDFKKYDNIISDFTLKDQKYSGFYNSYEAHVTLLNSLVETSVIQQQGFYYQWDKSKTRTEREKMFQEHSAKSKILLAFYTPERKDNDLEKPQTIWKVYLVHNGQRFAGKIKRTKYNFSQFVRLFPHFNRWSKAYDVSFDVPMNNVEIETSKIVITSSLGSSEFIFKPIRQ